MATSTGVQRSSRLLSMRGANALVPVPKGSGVIPAHSYLPALLIDELRPPTPASAFHRQAAGGGPARETSSSSSPSPSSAASASSAPSAAPLGAVRVCVLTVSDRASRGEYADRTGPALAAALQRPPTAAALGGVELVGSGVVEDDVAQIAGVVRGWCDGDGLPPGITAPPDVVLTAGGTGEPAVSILESVPS
eukprot:COSAG01_NODE_10145_length_2237_cov_2.528064_2_plen_193_part_00